MIERVRLPPRVRKTVSLREALTDPMLLGNILGGDTWRAWRILLIGAMGEPLDHEERQIFKRLTGRDREPGTRVEELVGVIGRRGGKTRAISALSAYIAGLCDHRHLLAPGERGIALNIAPDQRQARLSLDYAAAAFEASPIMRQLVVGRTTDALRLSTGVDLEVRSASFRRLRGPTYVCVIADEAAFWMNDETSSNPDSEILGAVRPALATTGGLLAIISSPHAKRGEVYEAHRRHYGPEGDPLVLVAQAPSRLMNPSLSQRIVDRALERDYAAASAEYLAQFRNDVSGFIDRDDVVACVDKGVIERPPQKRVRYFSFTDPSGGSADSMTTAIGHMDGKTLVVDALREIRAPFKPEDACEEFAQLFAQYNVRKTHGDKYSGQWCVQSFARRGINYIHSEMSKSALYIELLPRLNGKTIKLLDNEAAVSQISQLERRTGRGLRTDSVDHPRGRRDDVANVIAGLCGIASTGSTYNIAGFLGKDEADDDAQFRAFLRNQHIFGGRSW